MISPNSVRLKKIIVADVQEEAALQATKRINQLIGREVASPQQLEVSDRTTRTKSCPAYTLP